ncbi:MAG: glycosyltransferase [Gammaproteobacteria bacterium]|nr:glycosyltransferase [Gammaproteobacteria bacterium]
MIRLSLIIPAHNEEDYLARLLDTVDIARESYQGDSSAIEVIVVDNMSTDKTAEIARDRGCTVIEEPKRIIAAVRNRGASIARGEILLFTDADNWIDPNTFNAIDQSISSPKVVAGATGVHLERMSLGIAAAYMVMIPMVWITGMDTGVVFCRRADFEKIGGYNEARRFAEDVEFLWDLRKLGWKKGQRLVRLRSVKATTSTRKFDRFGDWHYVGLILVAMISWLIPKRIVEKMAKEYWYSDQDH